MLTLSVKKLTSTARLPVRATPDSACLDLYVDSVERDDYGWTVHTGLAVAFPAGYGMLIYPRSGLATKLGLTLRNTVGVIDSDYRGEILLKFHAGHYECLKGIMDALEPGSRIAQAMIIQVPDISLKLVPELPETSRGEGGFGSTGS